MSFFYELNKKLDSIRATPEVTHQQLNERDMGKHNNATTGFKALAAKTNDKIAGAQFQKMKKAGQLEEQGQLNELSPELLKKARDRAGEKWADADDRKDKKASAKHNAQDDKFNSALRKKTGQLEEVNEMYGPYDDDAKVDAINAANPPKTSGTGMKPAIPVKHHTYDRKDVASNISGEESAKYDYRGQVEEGPMDTVKKIGKRVASGVNRLVGHGSDEDMRKDVQRKAGVPQTGKKPEQKTTEAAKYRDPKYKDKLYTQEPPDYTYGPDMDDAYDNPKPDDYAGRKRKIGGGEFPSTDPLAGGQGIGRSGIKNNILDRGPRKGMPSRNQITSLKGSIKSARGTHAEPNLPEAAGSIDYEKVLEAIAALYGDDMWDNDAMGDLAQDLEQAGPTDRELDFIIAKGKLPTRLKGIKFTNTDDVQFGHLDEKSGAPMTAKQKSFAKLAPPEHKITFADKIAGAKKEVDEMLGDVAAEAMRSALGGGKGRNAEMDEERSKGTAFDMSTPRAAAPKAGSTERGAKHDIKHSTTDPRYKGRIATRRTDAQGNSVDADDASDTHAEPRGRGRPKGTTGAIGAKGPSGKSKLMTKEGADQGQAQQVVDDLAELRAIAKQSQRGGQFPQGFASQLEVVLYAAITLIRNQQSGDAQVREEEKTSTRDDRAEKAGKRVTKDIEYDEKKKDGIHGKKRGAEDAKAEKSGKKVAKDIEHDEKKKEKEVDESTTSGSVATSTATKSSKGSMVGKGIYDSMNRELENMIAESMSINMSDSTEGNKSLSVTATDDDAMKLAMILKSAGLGGGDAHGGCDDVQEAVDENSPDYPTNTETSNNAMQYAGGLNKPKTDVAGNGQTTIPNSAVHTQEEDALRRMMEMAGMSQNNQLDEGIMDMLAPYVKKAANALMSKLDPQTLQGLKQAHDQSGGDRNKFMAAIGITKQDLAPLAKDLQPVKEGVHDDSFSKAMFGSGTSLKGKVLTGIFNIVPTLGMTDLLTGGNIGSALTAATGGSVLQVIWYLVSAALIWGVGSYNFSDMDKEPTKLGEDDLDRMMEMAGIKKKEVDEEKTDEGNKFAFNVLKAKEAGKKEADLDGDGDMEKVRESIFALNNQWQAYKG